MFSKKLSLTNQLGQEVCILALEHLWADVYGIKYKKLVEAISVSQVIDGIKNLLSDLDRKTARQVNFRLIKDRDSSELSSLLSAIGFQKKNERVEYKKTIAELPTDEGSPLNWKSALDLNWRDKDIAEFLNLVSQGDPDSEANQDPLLYIQDFMADPVLTSGLQCVHIGFFNNEKAALSVVQINPKSGWSRISYMGIAPKFRRKSLGKWIHRFSFRQMKSEGGTLYHGGTDALNTPMIRLFESHGCKLFCEMEEWIYQVNEIQR